MKDHEFAQLLGGIDPELIARAEAPAPVRKKRGLRIALLSIAAALLVLLVLAGAAAIASLPKIYPLDYESPKHLFANETVQIYYTKDGEIKSQNVLLPPSAENIYMTWQHLNGLGEEFALIQTATSEDSEQGQMTLTLSTALRDHPESEALLDSLQKTFTLFYGMQAQSLCFDFSEQITEPEKDLVLQFSHNLPRIPAPIRKGTTTEITVTMTNVSDHDIVHEGYLYDFVPSATLRGGGLTLTPYPHYYSTEESGRFRLPPGKSVSITYTFDIPYALPIMAYYDLVMSYGEYSETVENAVLLAFSDPNNRPAIEAFYDFSEHRIPNTKAEFGIALQGYTIGGVSIMDDMKILSSDTLNGWSETGKGKNCSYTVSTRKSDLATVENMVFTTALPPDDWFLPQGMLPQDSVHDTLLNMGFDEQMTTKFLSEHGTIRLAGFDPLSSTMHFDGTLYLHCKDDTYVVEHTYTKSLVYQDDLIQRSDKTIQLIYNRQTQSLENIRIEIQVSTLRQGPLPQPVIFTQIAGRPALLILAQDEVEILQEALFKGMITGTELAETEFDCKGTMGDQEFWLSSKKGILQYQGIQIHLNASHWEILNQILGCPSPYSDLS